jgi:hypothetical protein
MSNQILIHISNDYRSVNDQLFDGSLGENYSYFKTAQDIFAENNMELHTFDKGDPDSANLLIFFDLPYIWDRKNWALIKSFGYKSFLFCFEPPIVNPFNYIHAFHRFFKRIYTWNDGWVDQKKYYKLFWPQSMHEYNRYENTRPFSEKKLLTLINGNKLPFLPFRFLSRLGKELYSERIRAIEFFENKFPEKLDLFGRGWNQPKKYNLRENLFGYKKYSIYRGVVDNKIELLTGYKFCLCFENITEVDGYLTEKIFDCFKAGCVPIYWGAENINQYIQQDCYIDFRQFRDYRKLLNFIENISEIEYSKYLKSISALMKDPSFQTRWFEYGFAEKVCKDVQISINQKLF